MYLCNCYLSGDALHGSGSRINPIKCYRSCAIHYFQDPPGSLQLVPVTRIEQTGETNGGLEIFQWSDSTSDPDQPVADGPVGPYVAPGPMGSYGMLSRVTLISLLLMARWARMLHVARWARVGCYPRVTPILTLISLLLMARWAPYVARGPVGSYGMLSPCDSDSDPDEPVADGPVGPYVTRGPVGSYGMLSPCDSDQHFADGPVGPFVTRGPVGSYGTSSPCDSDTPGLAGQYDTDGPVGPYIARSLVGPYGTLSLCDFETAGALGLYVADGPVDPCVPVGPLDLCGTSSPSDPKSAMLVDSGGTFPSSDVAVMWDPTIPAESASLRVMGRIVAPPWMSRFRLC